MKEDTIFVIILLLIIWFFYNLYKLYKYSILNDLKRHIKWCVIENSNFRYSGILSEYIFKEQFDLSVNEKYRLQKEDIEFIDFILNEYKAELIRLYFNDQLNTDSKLIKLDNEQYFFYTLGSYLSNHECECSLGNIEKFELIERQNYGSYGGAIYDADYSLTDFGRIYMKLLYLSSFFCEITNSTKKLILFSYSKNVKEYLDENKISIMSR